MCDPMSIIGLVASVGGAVMQMSAQSKVQKARSNVMAAERIRQQQYDQEAMGYNERSRDRYEDFGDQQDAKAKSLGEMFTKETGAGVKPSVEGLPQTPQSSSNIVVQESAKQLGQAKQFTDQQGNALGNLRAFGDLLGGISREQGRDAGYIGQIGGFKRGSSNVTSFELEEANNAGNSMAMMGQLVGGLGKAMGGMAGGGGLGSMFGAAPNAPAFGSGWSPTGAAPITLMANPSNPFKWY